MRSIYVDQDKWSQDIHHKSKIVCVDCHINANPYLHFREGFIDVDCARCHPEEAEEYQKNIHQKVHGSWFMVHGSETNVQGSRFKVQGSELKAQSTELKDQIPECYHCHTKHHILTHDDPASSIHEKNIGKTCGQCHAEVMISGLFKGTFLGKISGHRKGDLSERFDMDVCINCHYEDAAHGAKRVYKDFCSRCHNVRSKAGMIMGPTHTDSEKWANVNYLSGGVIILLLIGVCTFIGYRSRRPAFNTIKRWYENMKIE